MKVKVIKTYVDKHTKDFIEAGRTAEYEPERAKELINGGYVEEVKEKPKKAK